MDRHVNKPRLKQAILAERSRASRGRGFTLVELLVVISIIALLIAMLLPALAKARFHAQAIVCGSQLRQVGIAVAAYANDHNNYVPPLARTSTHSAFGEWQSTSTGFRNAQTHEIEPGITAIYPYHLPDPAGFYCPQRLPSGGINLDYWNPNVAEAPQTLAGNRIGLGYVYFGGVGWSQRNDGAYYVSEDGNLASYVVWRRLDEPSKTLMTDLAFWDNHHARYSLVHGQGGGANTGPEAGMNFLYQDTRVQWATLPSTFHNASNYGQAGEVIVMRKNRHRRPIAIAD